MDKFGKKLNSIWEEIRNLPEGIGKVTADALTNVAKSIDASSKANNEVKAVLDKLLITSEGDDKKRTVQGTVTVEGLYDELNKALKDNAPTDFDYPELKEMFRVLGDQIGDTKTEFDAKLIATELVKVLPKREKLTIDSPVEVFGKVLSKIEGNDKSHPLYVEVINAKDLAGNGKSVTTVSQGGSIPDDLIQSDGAGGRQLKVNASFTGTITTSPTYKDDPTATGETPKYGKTNSVTHKQQVEADISGQGIALSTSQDVTVKYKIADQDEISAIIHYYSFLEPSGKWYILRQDATNALTLGIQYRYTNGASGYATGWTNRATPTIAYTYINNLSAL